MSESWRVGEVVCVVGAPGRSGEGRKIMTVSKIGTKNVYVRDTNGIEMGPFDKETGVIKDNYGDRRVLSLEEDKLRTHHQFLVDELFKRGITFRNAGFTGTVDIPLLERLLAAFNV